MPETRSVGEILRDAELGRLENVFAESREPYDLVGAADRLFDLLDQRSVDYVLVGGMAMLQYVDGRNTRDVDLILDGSALERLPEIPISSQDADFARGDFEGVQIDILKTKNEVFDFVRTHLAATISFGERNLVCATPQGLFVLKAYALPSLYRQGEFARSDLYESDLRALLRSFEIDEDTLIAHLTPHMLPTDIKAIRDVLRDLRTQIARSGERARDVGSRHE
jgi:hypothetical protein